MIWQNTKFAIGAGGDDMLDVAGIKFAGRRHERKGQRIAHLVKSIVLSKGQARHSKVTSLSEAACQENKTAIA